jgi:DNA-binding transcriptional regulator LsrR (DeoR family)
MEDRTITTGDTPRRDLALMHRAARMYYLDELNQAAIAERLNVSRPTVSRLLADARRIGLVRITVHDPGTVTVDAHPDRLAEALGLEQVWLAPFAEGLGGTLSGPVGLALRAAALTPGDALLVSSGRTLYELSRTELPPIPGIDIGPTVGGVSEPEAWYQTNEITRAVAERMTGRPHFLFAQAMPSPAMRATLADDPDFRAVTDLWRRAKVALVGVGAPPLARDSISTSIPLDDQGLRTAVGDICLNFFDPDGAEVTFPGSDRMVRISPDQLRGIPHTIAVARGAAKVGSLIAGARARLYNRLVTDIPTAERLLTALGGG